MSGSATNAPTTIRDQRAVAGSDGGRTPAGRGRAEMRASSRVGEAVIRGAVTVDDLS
jgi:hypothetical protein